MYDLQSINFSVRTGYLCSEIYSGFATLGLCLSSPNSSLGLSEYWAIPIRVASGPMVKCLSKTCKNACTRTKLSGVTDQEPSMRMTRSVWSIRLHSVIIVASAANLEQGSAILDSGIPDPGFFVNKSQIPISNPGFWKLIPNLSPNRGDSGIYCRPLT